MAVNIQYKNALDTKNDTIVWYIKWSEEENIKEWF